NPRRLTPRSSADPLRQPRLAAPGASGIMPSAAKRVRLRGRLSSNVRPHSTPMSDQLIALARVVQHCQVFARERLRAAGEVTPFGAYLQPHSTKLNLLGAKASSSAGSYELLEAMVSDLSRKGALGAYALAAS